MKLVDAIDRAEGHELVEGIKENGGFLTSAYVILDPEQDIEEWNLSYYLPDSGEIASINVSDEISMVEQGEPVREKTFREFESVPDVSETEACKKAWEKAEEMEMDPNKIILSLQHDEVAFWSVTFLGPAGDALNVRIDAGNGEVLVAERSNLLRIESD